MNQEDMQAQLMAIFSVEAEEHLEAMSQRLVALEAGSGVEARGKLMADLFREAHSLKGAARAVNLPDVEAFSHELEDVFLRMEEEGAEPAAAVLERAFQTLDSIGMALGGGEVVETPSAHDEDGQVKTFVVPRRVSEDTVRIGTDKLDALMTEVGELLVARIGAERRVGDVRAIEATLNDWDSTWRKLLRHRQGQREGGVAAVDHLAETGVLLQSVRRGLAELRRQLDADARRTAQITTELQEDVRRTRMLPVSTVLEPFSRMVRDLARDSGKEVTLSISGGATEVDRSVLEQIKDPLTHLLRNGIDHGIEAPEVRARAGKPRTGTISLSAIHRGDMLIIEVADDGAGIDVDGVRRLAVENGLHTTAAAAELSDRQAISLIFRSGFSTSPMITDLSRRGVGLDVVREAVELLHGSTHVESTPGAGTAFSLSVPLSVSSMHCLLIEAEGQTFALPVSAVERVMRARPEEIGRAEGRETVRVDGRPVVLARLSAVLGLDVAVGGRNREPKWPIMVLGGRERHAAFLVDHLAQTHEVVVKSLPEPLLRVRHLAGATILGSGQVALILNPADLMDSVERADGSTRAVAAAPEEGPATVLVVEDSITTRTLEKNILEAAGYRVRVAGDGADGWSLLQSDGCDLVVADIEMPVMDGLELTARIRADQRYRNLPVVLVTSRDSREDREFGIQAGADAYIVKGRFDQDRLLATIRRLL